MGSTAIRRAFSNRVRALARDLPAALDNDVEALHRSRVASRRLREILPVLEVGDGSGRGPDSVRRRVRRLTRALGRVRELDVSLGILEELAARHPDLADVAQVVRAEVAEERRAEHESMTGLVGGPAGLGLPDELTELSSKIQAERGRSGAGELSRRLGRRADRLDAAILDAGSLYAADRLHQVRIAAKQLRYVLELVHEFGGVGTRRLTSCIKRFQDVLGRLHDLEVVLGRLRRHAWTGTRGEADRAAALAEILEREVHEQHAVYLAGVDALRSVLAECRTRVHPRLVAARAPRRRSGGGT